MGRRSREKAARRDAAAQTGEAQPPARPGNAPRVARPEPILELAPPRPFGELWRDHRTAIVALFAVALAYRLGLLLAIARTPYLEVNNVDSDSYQQWALDLVAGHWLPTHNFYQSPFYAYFLAILYKLFGTGPWGPRVVQILIGSASPVLVYAIGAQLFSRRVGWIAGLALALYGPIVLEEITLSKTSPLIATALAGFAAYVRGGPGAHLAGLAVAGFLFGVSVMGVAQWLLAFALLAAYVLVLAASATRARRLVAAGVFVAAGLVAFGPVVAWNSVQGRGLVLTSGGAGLNLYSGNNPRATGLPARPVGLRDVPEYEEDDARRLAEKAIGRPLSSSEVDRYWSAQAFSYMRDHPAAFLGLLEKKIEVLWNAYEIPDNYHYGFVRRHFLPMLWIGVTFAVVGPFALVGLAIPLRRRGAVPALYLVCLGYLVTPLLYYVRSRYRLPAVPFLLVFAAVAVDHLAGLLAGRRWQAVGGWSAALALAALFVNHEYCDPAHDGFPAICLGGDAWYDIEWKRLAIWYQKRGDADQEQAYLERALECSSPRSVGDTHLWIGFLEARRAATAIDSGQRDEATRHFERAERFLRSTVELKHRVAYTQAQLGSLYSKMGMPARAVEAYEAARKAGPVERRDLYRLAASYADLGRCSEAGAVLAEADRSAGVPGRSTTSEQILARCAPK